MEELLLAPLLASVQLQYIVVKLTKLVIFEKKFKNDI